MSIVNANAKQKLITIVVTLVKVSGPVPYSKANNMVAKEQSWAIHCLPAQCTTETPQSELSLKGQCYRFSGYVSCDFQMSSPKMTTPIFFFFDFPFFVPHFRNRKHSKFWKLDPCDVKRCTDTSCRLVTIHPPCVCVCPDVVHPWDCLVYVPSTCKEEFYRKLLTEC